VDLQISPAAEDLSAEVGHACPIVKIRRADQVADAIRVLTPHAVLFEYNNPRAELLEPLKKLASNFPALRFVMITRQHSENLAVWALRARIWDYLVKPVNLSYLLSRILLDRKAETTTACEDKDPPYKQKTRSNREKVVRSCDVDGVGAAPQQNPLTPALTFVQANYAEKVTLEAAAQLCGLGRYEFSRAFKRAHGTTFREFVILHRIHQAEQMLCLSDVSITHAAFAVGFNDLSHFAEMFRRYVGLRPSDYVQATKRKAAEPDLPRRLPSDLRETQNYPSVFAKQS
jgi:AraC-like DNA-binding protein